MVSPILGALMRPFSYVQKVQMIIANNLKSVVTKRKEKFDEYKKVDLIQLLLQQDQERQKNENVRLIYLDYLFVS